MQNINFNIKDLDKKTIVKLIEENIGKTLEDFVAVVVPFWRLSQK